MSIQQAEAVRAANASAHKKSRSVRHKVPPSAAGYAALSMTVMATLFRSNAAASQSPQQPMWPQPNAITASGLIPPGMIPMQPQALAPLRASLPPLPADPNMTSVSSKSEYHAWSITTITSAGPAASLICATLSTSANRPKHDRLHSGHRWTLQHFPASRTATVS